MEITTHPHPYLEVNRTRNSTTIWSGLSGLSNLDYRIAGKFGKLGESLRFTIIVTNNNLMADLFIHQNLHLSTFAKLPAMYTVCENVKIEINFYTAR